MKDIENQRERINKGLKDSRLIENYEDALNNNRLDYYSSNNFNNVIRNLSNPRFLGSYHLKQGVNTKFKSIERLLRGELKYTKSLKSIVFNPITITLIVITLIFNLFWIFQLLF